MTLTRATYGCCGAPVTGGVDPQHKCLGRGGDAGGTGVACGNVKAPGRVSHGSHPAPSKPAGRVAEDALAEALAGAGYVVRSWREWLKAVEEGVSGDASVVREYRWGQTLDPERRYRSDFAFPLHRLLLEVDGRVHHVVAKQGRVDVLRAQIAQQAGYRILRVLPDQVHNGEAIALVRAAIKEGGR